MSSAAARVGAIVTDLLAGYQPPRLHELVRRRDAREVVDSLLQPDIQLPPTRPTRLRAWVDENVARVFPSPDQDARDERADSYEDAVTVLILLQRIARMPNDARTASALPLLAATATPALLARLSQREADEDDRALLDAARARAQRDFESARAILQDHKEEEVEIAPQQRDDDVSPSAPSMLHPQLRDHIFPQLPPAHDLHALARAIETVRAGIAREPDWRAQLSDADWRDLRNAVADGLRALGVGVDVLLATARSPADAFEQLALRLRAELVFHRRTP